MEMIQIEIDEVKRIEFDILKYIKNICDENSIKYSLGGGTLLGAVRHRGFIPWDDDIDIMLPLPDYDKLIEILKKDNKYKLYTELDDNDNYFYGFSKLVNRQTVVYEVNKPKKYSLGVWVDIFPITAVPRDCNLKKYLNELDKMNTKVFASKSFNYCYDPNQFKMAIKSFIKLPRLIYCKSVGIKKLKIMRDKLKREENYQNAILVGFMPSVYGEKDIFPKKMFDNYTEVEFEGEKFSSIEEWDKYLTQLYGDYMKIPPIEQRNHPHFEAFKIL